jgi:hypothetical protein
VVLGLVAVPLALVPVLYLVGAVPCGVLALALGRRARQPAGGRVGPDAARWGSWLGAAGLLVALVNLTLGAIVPG